MINCFHFTYQLLKEKGYNIPYEWEYFKADCDLIKENPNYFLDNNLHDKYFSSFTTLVNKAIKNDIIVHKLGVGIAINETHFMTLNHLQNIKIRPIRKKHCKILRVNNG